MTGSKKLAVLAIFTGSLLVFGVQPMVGNTLLPYFGGTAAVWIVCLAAFQTLLLAGYFYAHLAVGEKRLSVPRLVAHALLIALSAVWVAVAAMNLRPIAGWAGNLPLPALGALLAVILLVGVPYVLLSSNASLVQALAAQSAGSEDGSIYKLYAVSNIGSFCGLLAYPLLVEPYMAISSQWLLFAVGLAIYAGLVAAMIFKVRKIAAPSAPAAPSASAPVAEEPVSAATSLSWLALSALSCFMLNGISAHLCNDVTPLPLMWAVMLALYLLSWVVGFTTLGSRLSPVAAFLTVALSIFAAWHVVHISGAGFFIELGVGCAIILFGGWTVHARLFKSRPSERHLTRYYLFIALGGAIGGIAASLVVPSVFTTVVEYPVALTLLFLPAYLEFYPVLKPLGAPPLDRRIMLAVAAVFAAYAWHYGSRTDGRVVLTMRNFYGTGRVLAEHMHVTGGTDYDAHIFEHAGIQHGLQPTWIGLRRKATLCFGEHAGGLSIKSHPKYKSGEPLRVAVAGMGVATLATYARPGDEYRFYEINPQVATLAQNTNLFWYVADCEGKLDIVVDDARRALEKERDRDEPKWDVIIVDVFAGDSIPPHMSTKEAFQLYLDRLAPGGILSMHLTNWHLALSPMVKAAAREFNLNLQGYGCWADKWSIGSYWTFLTREPADFFIEGRHGRVDYSKIKDIPLMTDEKHSLLPYISTDPMPQFE